MAKPRVFVSSTYYDLRSVRADMERFIREMGYEPVLFERGHIAYGREEALENYCYREIETCDMVVTIVGGKYGSQSKDQRHSITQRELSTALEHGKQVYIFVERAVASEYRTYSSNKDLTGFRPATVDNTDIFRFIDELYALPYNNPIESFEVSEDIIRFLREQWAGLFQRLLQASSRESERNAIDSLKSATATLEQLVTYLSEERARGDETVKDILLSSHPAFKAVRSAAKIPYRIIFYTLDELKALLEARGFAFDEEALSLRQCYEWDDSSGGIGLRVSTSVFEEDGKLRPVLPEFWDSKWVKPYPVKKQPAPSYDDDIPF